MSGPTPDPTAADLASLRRRVEELLGGGDPLLAFEEAEQALARSPADLRLRQLRGLALARSGAAERANEALLALRGEGHEDGETLGILARTHKDLAERASGAARLEQLGLAFDAYRRGYEASLGAGHEADACFTGINAATASLLLGEPERASAIAREVELLCGRILERSRGEASRWTLATLAEAALLLGDLPGAQRRYREAAALVAGRHGDLATMRRQARRILEARHQDASWIDAVLRVPPVVVCTGHMIDLPDRFAPRLPPELEPALARVLRDELARIAPAAGWASAACGADLLFLEAMLERCAEVHVVLPFPAPDFVRTSVQRTPGREWADRFERVLAAASSVTLASDHAAARSAAPFAHAGLTLTGLALLRARVLDASLQGIAVWDGTTTDGPGGAGWMARHWQSIGIPLRRIDPCALAGRSSGGPEPESDELPSGLADDPGHRLMAILCADTAGYGQLTEDQIPLFVEHLLQPIARLVEASETPPVLRETAGDAFYFVFEDVRGAALLALRLQELVAGTPWEEHGLPAALGLRVALHCGPVHRIRDPITGQERFTGPHTIRAARIEPITPPGQVYASQAFAAIAAASGLHDVVFEYVGRTELAKRAGSLPLYHVRRPAGRERRSDAIASSAVAPSSAAAGSGAATRKPKS
jgi:hypothetical protein